MAAMVLEKQIEKVEAEIAEFNRLIEDAKIDSVKSYLREGLAGRKSHCGLLKTQLENLNNAVPSADFVSVTKYAWDQTDSFVKIYVTGLTFAPTDEASLEFSSPNNFKCTFGKYRLVLANLSYNIDKENSSAKISGSKCVIRLKKEKAEIWSDLQKKEKDSAMPKVKDDPQAGLMSLLQNMYQSGDDNMRQMINKSAFEAQQKGGSGLNDMGKLNEWA